MAKKDNNINKIRRYPIAVYIIVLLSGIILIVISILSINNNISSLFMNLGTDFIGVTLLFFILKFFLIDDRSSESMEEIKSTLTDHISIEVQKALIHLPQRSYPSSQEGSKPYNFDVTQDFSRSSFYFYKGITARYVPVRLRGTRNSLAQVRVVMLDPSSQDVILLRANDRARNPRNIKKTIEKLSIELKDELYMTVVALFDCRHICPVEIIYDNSGTSIYSLEIMDQHAYLSFYQSDASYCKTFAEASRYSKDSEIYHIFKLEVQRLLGVSSKTFMINKDSTEQALIEHLRSIGFEKANRDTIKNYRERFDLFYSKEQFRANVVQL